MQCFLWLLVPAGAIFVLVTIQRWFEQTEEAVDQRQWSKLVILVLMPFSVWLFPGRIGVGRAVPVPRHEPVRGFGVGPAPPARARAVDAPADVPNDEPQAPPPTSDVPPPGTPPEFLVKPVIPDKPRKRSAGPDPEKMAKLRQKMREQGMIPDED